MNSSLLLRRIRRLAPLMVFAAAGSALASEHHPEAAAARHAGCDPVAAMAHHHAMVAAGPGGTFALIPAKDQDSQSEHVWSEDKNEIRITRAGGKVIVRFNGREVMDINDEDLFQTEVGDAREQAARAREFVRSFRDRALQGWSPLAPQTPTPPRVAWAYGQTPKVMIGVTMETAQEAGADVPSGVDADEATVITRVVEGLPAEKAGLKEGDLVVKVNGNSPAAPENIRDAIRDLNPGDTLTFRVSREGAEQDIPITLDKFDGSKLGSTRWRGSWSSEDEAPHALTEEDVKRLDELRARMDQTSAQLAELGQQMARTKGKEERERLALEMEELGQKMAELGSEMGELSGHEGDSHFFGLGQQGFNLRDLPRVRIERGSGTPGKAWIFTPDGAQGGAAAESDRVESLEKRLDKIERLLEKLAEKEEKR